VPHTLLLADDSVTIQRVIELTFADEDVRVVAVGDGDQAIAALEKSPPDIVLADIGMPGRTGYEVAEHVKATPSLAHIPVILLTGAFEPVDQNRATRSGCDGVLAKPFEPQLVVGKVKELLARPKNAAAAAPPATPAPLPPSMAPAELEPFPAEASEQATPAAVAAPVSEIDAYFDRLDEAFANLAGTREAPVPSTVETEAPVDGPEERHEDAPRPSLSYGSPAQAFESAASSGVAVATPTPAPTALPALGDAFSALFAAEQASPPSSRPVWPAAMPAPAPAPIPTEEIVEQVVERVLQRLSDHSVQRTVTDVVSTVAERLVREEIDRIKAALK
jgi:CheY-like chemotaxis protein